jgi:monoamine oxidase
MQRRDFLRRTGLFSTGTLLSSQLSTQVDVQPLAPGESVLIIGAGLAGLGAAYRLYKKSIPFTLLECRNRVGGRVFTHVMDQDTGLYTELGAEWVGASHEVLIGLCKELNLKLVNHSFQTHFLLKGTYNSPSTWEADKTWDEKFKSILKQYYSLSPKQGQALDQVDWWRYLVDQRIPQRELEIHELNDSTDFGETIRNVSAFSALAEYAESSPNNEMDFQIEGGNCQLVKAIVGKIGMEKILLSKQVTHINQTGKEVEVLCKDGSHYKAGRLICTAPAFSVTAINWNPALPPEKAQALRQLQYARIIKAPVLFRERFWKEESFCLLSDTLSHFIFHSTQNQQGPKGMLTAYAIGDKAHVYSRLSPQQQAEALCQALKPVFGEVSGYVEKAESYYWGDDAYTQGAYANYDVGQWYGIREKIGKPFQRVLFAGEHIADWQGFMEGALQTGTDAAKSLAG